MESIKSKPSKSSTKEHSLKKKIEETLMPTKKAYKRIHSQESSSEDSENAGSSRGQHNLNSCVTGEDNSPKIETMKLKRSSKKHSKKNDEEIWRLTKSSKEKEKYNENCYSKDSSSSEIDIDAIENDADLFGAKCNDLSHAGKFIEKPPSSPATSSINPDLTEQRSSSPFRFWGRDAFIKPVVSKILPEGEHIKDSADINNDSAQNVPKIENNAPSQKDWEKFKAQHAQRNLKNERTQSGITVDKEYKRDGTAEDKVGACALNIPKLAKFKSKEFLKKQEDWKDQNRPKIDDAKNADKIKPTNMGSNENIADLKFSPITAENEGVPKRRSDPNNALKENRLRTSF